MILGNRSAQSEPFGNQLFPEHFKLAMRVFDVLAEDSFRVTRIFRIATEALCTRKVFSQAIFSLPNDVHELRPHHSKWQSATMYTTTGRYPKTKKQTAKVLSHCSNLRRMIERCAA